MVQAGRRVAELFAGVGGFRLGLERAGWNVVWSNQWEPSTKAQHASDCYVSHFGPEGHVNDDIAKVLDAYDAGEVDIPDFDLLCGGFPCQDYSVAKTLNQANGIEGKKGVLWWQIHRLLERKKPRYVFLENVDRLLKSPASQRGRDFAIILACLSDLGYVVEWRVVNAADYGFPQRRRRVFIIGELAKTIDSVAKNDPIKWITTDGVFARALPIDLAVLDRSIPGMTRQTSLPLDGDLAELSVTFGSPDASPFRNAGIVSKRKVWTQTVMPLWKGKRKVLGDILQAEDEVAKEFFVSRAHLKTWRYLKGAKREERKAKNGHEYFYTEGAIAFPDSVDEPSRTILTGEGGRTASRFKHIIKTESGRYRRLTPIELERLNGFPDDWTNTGMPTGRRAFMMGNALIVGAVERIARIVSN